MKLIVTNRYQIENINNNVDVPHIIISIGAVGQEDAKVRKNKYTNDVLFLKFDDTATKGHLKAFTEKHADKIQKFVKKNLHMANAVICHCEAGISRSAAVAAALSKYYNGNDSFFFEQYIPNGLVYSTLLAKFHNVKK